MKREIIAVLLRQGRRDLAGIVAEEWKDKIPGGLGDEKQPEQVDSKQLEMGIKVELEHTDDPEMAKEIAIDHLVEIPDYYTRLAEMEKAAEGRVNRELERAIAATLKQAGRSDLASHFTQAQPSRVDRVLMKYQQNVLSDLRTLIMKSGAASGAQKNALQAISKELGDSFGRIGQLVSGL